jgi:hypothetical protein
MIPRQHSKCNPHWYRFENVEAPLVREGVTFYAESEFYQTEYSSDLWQGAKLG